ncbi:uncharacterized protein [Henckelia pumila]|uniref:uncharacterized protein n=1 Tax=Henckelia pumila TaxID=405737 RepID=UPI003C6DC4F2
MARGNNAVAATKASNLELASSAMAFICILAALYCFNQGDINDSDLAEVDLKMVYGALLIPLLLWIMSLLRRWLVKDHPFWCFGVEMIQAIASCLTMTGSVKLSMFKEDDKHFFESFGFITASLMFLKIASPDLEDCGLCDMHVALLLTRLNNIEPKLVPYVSGAYYIIWKASTFGMQQLNKERSDANEREAQLNRERPEEADANDPERGVQLSAERPAEAEANEREALERQALVEQVERETREQVEREATERLEREIERVQRETRELVEREFREQVEIETREREEREARDRVERETREREDAKALKEISKCWQTTYWKLRIGPSSSEDLEFKRVQMIIYGMQVRASRASAGRG